MREQQKALKSSKVQMLVSLDMDEVGNFVSKKLLENFSWQQILDAEITEAELAAIPGIGGKTAKIVEKSLKNRKKMVQKTARLFNFSEEVPSKKEEKAKGVVCFTGKSEFPRKTMQQKAEEMGYAVSDGITSEVTLLVCADPGSGSSKLKKAEKMGIKIMRDVDFLRGENG